MGVRFRAPGAPLLTLAAVGTAYTLAEQLVARVARRAGFAQPSLLRPLLVALVLGIVTDYVVFYLSNARTKTLRGESRLEAATRATAETTPIVLAGGAILTAGLMALEVARVRAFQELGPGLAVAVAVAVAVADHARARRARRLRPRALLAAPARRARLAAAPRRAVVAAQLDGPADRTPVGRRRRRRRLHRRPRRGRRVTRAASGSA